jgi:hypothetical protein
LRRRRCHINGYQISNPDSSPFFAFFGPILEFDARREGSALNSAEHGGDHRWVGLRHIRLTSSEYLPKAPLLCLENNSP